MANICSVSLVAKGFKNQHDFNECKKILENGGTNQGESWLPFFDVYVSGCFDILTASGWCKWTSTKLLDWYIDKCDEENLVSIQYLARKFGIFVEILGTEPGCSVGEHFGINPDGEIELEEDFDYEVYPVEEYETYEDFVEDWGDVLTKEQFDNGGEVGAPDTPFSSWILERSEKC